MVTRKSPAGKTPDELRQQRALVEFHDYSFRLANVKLTAPDGSARNIGVCYVVKATECHTVRLDGEECTPVHCSCKDTQYNGGIACKHRRMVALYLTNPPEPIESLVAALPVPPFNIDEEARHNRALADRDALWPAA